ncbi:MAG TPA: ABC transporter permease [Acidobacteriota bacterium]|nr:ABC transporter permease [Acidobacteriota bacterium]
MNDLGLAAKEALYLIFSADADIVIIVAASLRFALSSTIIASVIGIPAGIALANTRFRCKRLVEDLLNTLLAVPTVVVGLFVYTLIYSQGPLGKFQLLFTPTAIIIGQTLLILPLMTALALSAVSIVNPVVRETAITLGAGRFKTILTIAAEARSALIVAGITGFGRVIGEVGIALILGGNILGYTRTITTAISLETSKGEFAQGLALGMILLIVAFVLNLAIRLLRSRT